MKKHIIGIAGADGSGKTTLARHLNRKIESLANPIYLELIKEKCLDYTPEELKYSPEKHKYRDLLRKIGKSKREKRKDYWVEKLLKNIDESPQQLFVIDDVRYVNEAEAIKDSDGYLIYLDRKIKPKERVLDSFMELERVKIMSDLEMKSLANKPEDMAEIVERKMAKHYVNKAIQLMTDYSLNELIEMANNK